MPNFIFYNVLSHDDVLAASGGDEDVSFLTSLVHGGDLVTYKATEREDLYCGINHKLSNN